MRDAHAAGEEHDRSVGAERVQAAVGAFDESAEAKDAVRRVLGPPVELGRHAGAGCHDAC